jgi:hypothetical protein
MVQDLLQFSDDEWAAAMTSATHAGELLFLVAIL